MSSLIWPLINFSVLVVILVVTLKKPLANFVIARQKSLAKQWVEAQELLKEAQAQRATLDRKLQGFEVEKREIRDQLKRDLEVSGAAIIAQSKKLAGQIQADTQAQVAGVVSGMKRELMEELVEKVVQRSEGLVRQRLTTEDAARLKKDFSKKLEVRS